MRATARISVEAVKDKLKTNIEEEEIEEEENNNNIRT